MTRSALIELAERVEKASGPDRMRFAHHPAHGWIACSSVDAIKMLCDLWNSRLTVAASLRARAQMEAQDG